MTPDPDNLTLCWLMSRDEGAAALETLLQRLPEYVTLLVGVPEETPGCEVPAGDERDKLELVELPDRASLAYVINRAAARHSNTDVAVLFPGVTVAGDWLSRLRAAALSESTAATVSALPRDSVESFGRRQHRGAGATQDDARGQRSIELQASAVAEASMQLYPRLVGVLPGCIYLTSPAIELVGRLDESLDTDYAAILDFALSARERGLANLLADDVLLKAPSIELPDRDKATLTARHPSLMAALEEPPAPAIERSMTLASIALEPLTVTVDARALGPQVGGTQEYLLGLIESLAATREVQLRILVAPDLAPGTDARLRSLADSELLSYESALERQRPSHIVHRPQQVFSPDDLALLRPLGERVVITHQDLIAYHNPAYFPSGELWGRYVRTTRQALAAADHVLFFSHHALNDALREDLVERARCTVSYLGVSRDEHPTANQGAPPADLNRLADTPFLLCIGADYQHKNRPFAIAVLDELRRRHAWRGVLVLAGPHVDHGSSRASERAALAERSLGAKDVLDLATVSDEARAWLMRSAVAVIYPTVHEGFGLVPFEAAAAGVPCLFAPQSSLRELLDAELATLVPWDATRSADRAIGLLASGPERERHVRLLSSAAGELQWSDCASATLGAYRETIAAPYRASADAWQALEREQEIVRLDRGATELGTRLRRLSDDLGEDALALVGERALLAGSEQHLIVAVAARPALKRLVFGALRAGFRLMRGLSRARRR